MKKYFFPILLSIVVGFFTTKFMFDQYKDKENLELVFNNSDKLFFIQQGVYSSVESIEENLKKFNNYIYTTINNKYYVFIGITKNEEISKKIGEFYKDFGYITYVKEFNVDNQEFINYVENQDMILKETNDKEVIQKLINETITQYNETVVKNDKDKGNTN